MIENVPRTGRNCSFFPIGRGRFDSMLKTEETRTCITFFIPTRFHVAIVFWRLFFIYVLVFLISFAGLVISVNNGGLDIAFLLEHPNRNYYFTAAAAVVILPFLLSMILAIFKPYPALVIDRTGRTVKAGYRRRNEWKTVVRSYGFGDLGTIEVLRNYEFRGRGYIGRPVSNDSYELNLHFKNDGSWLGISESTMRQRILQHASTISRMTGIPYTENNGRDYSAAAASGETVPERPESYSDAFDDLPPFIRERIGEPVHSVEVIPSKLKHKQLPFDFKLTDETGQHFVRLIMPVVSHFANKIDYEKSLAAFEYMCSDRDAADRSVMRRKLLQSGWRAEDELLSLLCRIYDATSGPVPGLLANRDAFERYYMALKDDIRVPVLKYRIVFFEMLEDVVKGYPERMNLYERDPGSLSDVQNSENYALRFIIRLGFGMMIIVFGFFSVISLVFAFIDGSPESIAGSSIMLAVTIGLAVFRRKLGNMFGGKRV